MKTEKEYTEGIYIKRNKTSSKLENFWFYHKWHVIVGVFIIFVLTTCIVQCASKEDYDILFTYAGPKDFLEHPEEKTKINNSLSEASIDQFGEDASANLNNYLIYSEEQIKNIEQTIYEDESQKKKITVNTSQITKNLEDFKNFSTTGQSYIFLLDPYVYKHLTEQSSEQRFVSLAEVFGKKPACAYDDYALRLADTEIYKNSPALQALPEDTLICLHNYLFLSTKESEYKKHFNIFKKIATVSQDAKPQESQEAIVKKTEDFETD